jgi:hypothetical protein
MSSKMVLDLPNHLVHVMTNLTCFNLNLNLDNHWVQVFSRLGRGSMFIDITNEFLNACSFV